jgi:hypothetical protein
VGAGYGNYVPLLARLVQGGLENGWEMGSPVDKMLRPYVCRRFLLLIQLVPIGLDVRAAFDFFSAIQTDCPEEFNYS